MKRIYLSVLILIVFLVNMTYARIECECEGIKYWWKPDVTEGDLPSIRTAYVVEMAKFLRTHFGDIEQERFIKSLGMTLKQKITWETISNNILSVEDAIAAAGLELKYISLLGRQIGYQYAYALMGAFGIKFPTFFKDGVCHLRLYSRKDTGEILTRAILVRDAFGDGAVAEEIALLNERGFPVLGDSTHKMIPEYKEFLKAVISGDKKKAIEILKKQPDPPYCVQIRNR